MFSDNQAVIALWVNVGGGRHVVEVRPVRTTRDPARRFQPPRPELSAELLCRTLLVVCGIAPTVPLLIDHKYPRIISQFESVPDPDPTI